MARSRHAFAPARHSLVAFALACGTLAGVTAHQSASAAVVDQLVVVDLTDASTADFSASSLKTINADGSKSFASPVDLPTADGGGANAFALAGSTNGNGSLSRSANGDYLAIAGYNHAPGATGQIKSGAGVKPKDTKAATSSDGPGVQRMVARIGNTGTVDTSTLLGTAALDKAHPRGVATGSGSSFYVSGNGGSTDTGVFSILLGGGAKVAIAGSVTGEATKDQTNTRNIQIAGGDLYAVSEKTNLAGLGKIGTGLPVAKSAVTRLGSKSATVDLPVPTAFVMLDANSGVDGVDAGYVSVDTDDDGVNDEIRKYTSDGTTWTLNGTKTGDYPFLTAKVDGDTVHLFASKGSTSTGNTIVKFDDANGAGAASFGSETTIATAATAHAFRGIALAPTGWDPGTVSTDAPSASVANSKVGGTVGDAHNPGTTLTLADDDTDAADLTVTAQSSNTAVIPNAGVDVTGAGLERAVSFSPTGVGRANITFTVTDDNGNTATTQVAYAASATPASASGRYFYDSSDLSSAVDVGDGYTIAVSSEDNVVRLYKNNQSGRPVKTFDFTDGTTGIGSTNADLESMSRVNDTLYVLGSNGNNSSGDAKPARRVLFTVAIGGSGADTTLTYIAKQTTLWDDLRTWDQANGDRLGFAAAQATGVPANDPAGFNIEGLEFAPGSTSTAYLGFRAPLVTHDGKPSAVIVPVTNLNPLLSGAVGFQDPIYLDLGGRTIREIRKNNDDEYLISASTFGGGTPQWALFAWSGKSDDKPILALDLPNPDQNRTGSWESIVSVPSPLADGGSVSLISDSGDTTYYGDSVAGNAESKGFRKSYVDEFTFGSYAAYPVAPAHVTATPGPGSIDLGWDAVTGATSYLVKVKTGATVTSKSVNAPGTSTTISGLDSTKTYSTSVSAVNSSGTSDPTAGPDVTPQAPPLAPPSNLSSPTHSSSSVALAWTKVVGASDYILSSRIGSGPATTKHVGDVSSTSFTGLSASTEYSFDIAAVKPDSTESAPSSPLKVKTATAPIGASGSTTYGAASPYGVFYISPGEFQIGSEVTLSANFPTDQKSLNVTFYRAVGDTEEFEAVGVKKANASGNAYLTGYPLEEGQALFARTTKGKQTQRFVVEGSVEPGSCTRAGTISTNPTVVVRGALVTVAANFLTDQKFLNVNFYKVTGEETEVLIGTVAADKYGDASLKNVKIDDETLIRAETTANKCTKTLTITPKVPDPANFGTPTGTLTVNPTDVRVGEDGKLVANFASTMKGLSVSFFHKVSGSPDTWESVGSATANSSGDATLSRVFNAQETFFALTSTGVASPQLTVKPLKINGIASGSPTPGGKNVLFVVTDNRKTPTTKGVVSPGATAWSTDGGTTVTSTFPLETFSVRGNTTALLAKKPFKLKFIDGQKPFGLKKDKTWILVANYNDHSFVRNFASEDLGQKLSKGLAWTPKSEYTELYVNGRYQGSYLLIQSIKIDSNRLDINKETGQIIEFDPWWKRDGLPGMEGPGAFQYLDYSWKDPDEYKKLADGKQDPEGLTSAKISAMKTKIRTFEKVLYGSTWTKDWSSEGKKTLKPADDWMTYLDLNSAVDYYIVKEFTKDTDSDMYRSNFFYTNDVDPKDWGISANPEDNGRDNKFYMGPVWDFDRSAGARNSSTMPTLDDTSGWWLRGTTYHNTGKIHWFTRITKDPRFLAALKARWNGPLTPGSSVTVRDTVRAMSGGSAAGNGSDAVSRGAAAMGGGDASLAKAIVSRDDALWGSKSDRLKPRTNKFTNAPAADDRTSELGWLRDWYYKRYLWIDGQIN